MIKGFPGDKKIGDQVFSTVSPQGSDRAGQDVLPKAIYQVNPPNAITAEAVDTTLDKIKQIYTRYKRDPRFIVIKSTGHSFRVGDVLRFRTADANFNKEMPIVRIIDADHALLGGALDTDPTGTDFFHMRHITLTINAAGQLTVSTGALEFFYDGASTQVQEDTADPVNNRFLPVKPALEQIDVISPIHIQANNIPASSSNNGLEIIAATSASVLEIHSIETIGQFLGLYSGPDGALVLEAILPIAGGKTTVSIPSGTRLSLKHMQDTALTADTYFAANLLG